MDRSRASMQGRDHSHTLLGHAPRDPFACADAQGKPTVDFSDVFGGPPTRISGSGDAGVGDEGACAFVVGEEDGKRSRRWSSSVVEKPAFTGVGSPAHQRHLGDDFFSDIFRGGESACPTPRRRDRELFSPFTPGSRVLSPARTLPPTGDALSGVASSLPPHLSYSSRLAKSFDYSSFRCPTAYAAYKHEESIPDVYSIPSSPYICPPASPSRFARIKDYLRFDTHASPRQSSLSDKVPHIDRPLETITPSGEVTDETEKQPKKASTGSKAYSGSGHFHFSIYKWASKGVTLVMPSTPKERAKSGLSSQVVQPVDLPLDNENMPQGTQGFQSKSELGDTILFDDLASAETDDMGLSKQVTEPLPATSDIKSVQCDFPDRSDDTGTGIKNGTGLSEEEGKPESKSVRHPISDNSERKGNGGTTREAEMKESLLSEWKTVVKDGDGTAKIKHKNRGNTILGCTDVSQDIHGAPAILEDKIIPASAKEKAMNFVKNLHQEAAQKTSATVESRSRRPKFKDEVKGRVGDPASTPVVAADQEDYGNYGEALSTPVATSRSPKKAEQKAFVKSSGVEKMDGFFPETSGTTASLSGSTLDSFDASFCNIEEAHFENIEECLVEELSQDQHEVTETDLHQEETKLKMSETRIQEWSKGKEGNIRSLLSTLQYVLWPGSGWKPVPLVDIIEGASVRRAYQKALLCLHPDKLQQKGAETHQKYIAEKVFDMLQEAWNHFNSLSSL